MKLLDPTNNKLAKLKVLAQLISPTAKFTGINYPSQVTPVLIREDLPYHSVSFFIKFINGL